MRIVLLTAVLLMGYKIPAQNNTAYNIIEGGKTLVELIKVFKTPRPVLPRENLYERIDSCSVRKVTDLCIHNSTGDPFSVLVQRRNGNGYEGAALSMTILPRTQECLYELKAGVYKMKIEKNDDGDKILLQEGEIILVACQRYYRDIRY